MYSGRVVNVTKFGAFVNILPGRDGLVHISKLGRGKRVDRVEDVLNLGDAVEVRVDDIDPQGKVSLTPVGDADGDGAGGNGGGGSGAVAGRSGPAPDPVATTASAAGATGAAAVSSGGGDVQTVSFEDAFDAEIRSELGDLGPASRTSGGEGGGERRGGGGGGRRRTGGGGGGGRGRRS